MPSLPRFISFTFGRPTILPTKYNVSAPNSLLDQPSESSEIPSPMVAKILQYHLAVNLPDHGVSEASNISFIEDWIGTFPRVFAIESPDLRWDAKYPRLLFQRFQLHNTVYSTLLQLLRRHLLSPRKVYDIDGDESRPSGRVGYAVETAIKSINASEAFFQATYPGQARYFMIAFCPFDTATRALRCASA